MDARIPIFPPKVVVTRDDREMERERVPCPLDPSQLVALYHSLLTLLPFPS